MTGSLPERLRAALTAARKDRDQPRTLLFSTVLADLKNREIELGRPLDDPEATDVLRRGIKRRGESVEAFRSGGRNDLAEREAREIAELERYVPPLVPEAEIRTAVREAIAGGAGDLGAVMRRVMPAFKGRADGATVNRVVREELSAAP